MSHLIVTRKDLEAANDALRTKSAELLYAQLQVEAANKEIRLLKGRVATCHATLITIRDLGRHIPGFSAFRSIIEKTLNELDPKREI